MIELAIEAQIIPKVQVRAELVALFVKFVGRDPCRPREDWALAGYARRRRRRDTEILMIGIVIAKPHLAIERQINVAVGVERDEFERIERIGGQRRVAQIAVILLVAFEPGIVAARPLALVEKRCGLPGIGR